jgi:hypothetical protein
MKLFRNSKKNIINDVLNIVPSDVRLVSFISLNINPTSFIEYIDSVDLKKMNTPIFVGESEKPIEKDDIMFYVLILALVHENEKMLEFLHKILFELGNEIDLDIFRNQIKDIDALITNKQIEYKKGGADLKKMLYELLIIGVLIYTAFYDYFIITSGIWQKMGETASELTKIATQIQSGCGGTYVPSEKANFLSKYGFGYYGIGNSDVVYKIDSVVQCMTQPSVLTSNLEEIFKKENDEKILGDLFVSLNNAYPAVFSDESSLNESKQLVLAKPSFENYGLVVRNPEMNTMDIQKTTKQLEAITKMNPDEFKNYILSSMKPVTPSKESDSNTYLSSVTEFMSDLYHVVANEIGPVKMTPSLSVENAVLYSIQDNIKNAWRHMEDLQTQTKRKIQDKITDTSRLITEITSLPRILYTLFTMNSAVFCIILYFINKMTGGKSSKNKMIENNYQYQQIEDDKYGNNLKGGRKRRKNTLKKNKKNNKSRRKNR